MVRLLPRLFLFTAIFVCTVPASAREPYARLVATANYLVNGPTTSVGQLVADRAEEYRREIALTWFGTELPQSEHVSLVYVNVDESRSIGRTIVSPTNRGHHVSLIGPLAEVSAHMLAHEVAHTVIAARYGLDFPAWANEGIASIYDDLECYQIRERIEQEFIAERSWPNLANVMVEPIRSQAQYTVAASLTQYLLAHGSRSQFLKFAETGHARGWDAALRNCYAIGSVSELQLAWQQWVTQVVIDRERQTLVRPRFAAAR